MRYDSNTTSQGVSTSEVTVHMVLRDTDHIITLGATILRPYQVQCDNFTMVVIVHLGYLLA